MNSQDRKQTTQGIFLFAEERSKLLVFDVEGNDSRERLMQNNGIENKLFLFSLAVSNIVMINMWTQDVGRFKASNYQILRQSFELNLRFVDKIQKKKIIFILRDFQKQENLQRICEIIQQDIQDIWNQISKPPMFLQVSCFQLFEFQIIPIAHKFFDQQQYQIDVQNFAQRIFNEQNDGYFFNNIALNNVPLESFYQYCENIWQKIDNNKDLDIADEKLLISVFRCAEIEKTIVLKCQQKFKDLAKKIQNINVDFQTEYIVIKQSLLNEFDENTQYYDKQKVDEFRFKIEVFIENEFEKIFLEYNERIINQYVENMTQKIEQILINKESQLIQNLKFINENSEQFVEVYIKFIKRFNFAEWKQQNFIKNFKVKWSQRFMGYANVLANQIIDKLSEKKMNEIQEIIYDTFECLNEETWKHLDQMVGQYCNQFTTILSQLALNSDILKPIMTDNFCKEKIENLKIQIVNQINNQSQNLQNILFNQFKRQFMYDERNHMINWLHWMQTQIDHRYDQIFSAFKLRLQQIPPLLELQSLNVKILQNQQLREITKKFDKSCHKLYENIIQKKNSYRSDGNMQTILVLSAFLAAYFILPDIFFKFVIFAIILGVVIYQFKKLKEFFGNGNMQILINGFKIIFDVLKKLFSLLKINTNQNQNQNRMSRSFQNGRRRSSHEIFSDY